MGVGGTERELENLGPSERTHVGIRVAMAGYGEKTKT